MSVKVSGLAATYRTRDGAQLHTLTCPPEGDARGWVVLIHGVAEHSGRYAHVVERFKTAGFGVFAFDGRAHGRSAVGRPSALIHSLDVYVDDLQELHRNVSELAMGEPCFILGHSMGALVLAYYLIRRQPEVNGAILSGIPLVPAGSTTPITRVIVGLLGRCWVGMPTIRLDCRFISRDPSVVEAYTSDPLVFRGRLPARTASEILRVVQFVHRHMEEIESPVLILHGGDDRIARVEGSRELFAGVAAADKTLRVCEGLFHEVLNEPDSACLLDEIVGWMNERC